MPWKKLDRFNDIRVPKLFNLKRASLAGFAIPPTVWARAIDLERSWPVEIPKIVENQPCIVRSGSPTEDTQTTSNAGQLLSLVVTDPSKFANAVSEVVAALPRQNDQPLGVVFVQPLIDSKVAGITFFDGFYYEETSVQGTNADLTQGLTRGQVRRGHLQRHLERDLWLAKLQKVFGGTVDIEWALTKDSVSDVPVLLQIRPALFEVKRNETLSLANHKEILGNPPSPWMTGILVEAGQTVMSFFAEIDPEIAGWKEPYAVELGEQAWMNFAAFFRLMDHWGMPRSMVTEGVGGMHEGPLDGKILKRRVLQKLGIMLKKPFFDLRGVARINSEFRRLDRELDRSKTLVQLYETNVQALEFSIRSNFAIMSMLSVVSRLRRSLGIKQAGKIVTHEMMNAYSQLAAVPDHDRRMTELDHWLEQYGHRGPLESDPAQPRFQEMRDRLQKDLERAQPGRSEHNDPSPNWLFRPLFVLDEVREGFRDQNMKWWQRLRNRILEEANLAVKAGHLETVDDVFFLRGDDFKSDPSGWKNQVDKRKTKIKVASSLILPDTSSRDEIEAAIANDGHDKLSSETSLKIFRGIGLGTRTTTGTAVVAKSLSELLGGVELPENPILVAATLEPSWAVVFPRFEGVVVELGGELSHASILLREARIPSIVNASKAYQTINSGDRLMIDPRSGTIQILDKT